MAFGRDLALAARTLRKSPGFAATAIVTIALGIGATTAVFSVVNTVLLRPLPYDEPGRLVLIQNDLTARNVIDFPVAPADFADIRQQGTMYDGVAGIFSIRAVLANESGESEQIRVSGVTTNLLSVLGIGTVLGRGFIEADGIAPPPAQGPAGPAVTQQAPPPGTAVLTYGFWQRRFGGDSSVIGRTIRLGGGNQLTEIVGVLEPGVRFLWPAANTIEPDPDVLTAMRIDFAAGSRQNVFLRVVARLKPGVSLEQARAQMQSINQDLLERFPGKVTAGVKFRVEPMQADLVADVRTGLLALMGAVVFVLLIACANVANLLLVRAAQRERELIVRAALGASRADLVGQMFAESLLIAGTGAVIGIGLAFAGLGLLRGFAPAHLPRVAEVGIDIVVLAFTMMASLVAAVVFGMVPALRASRPDAGGALRSASRTGALAAGRTLRSGVVIAEVALAFVLLVGSGLMVRSMIALVRVDPGFDPRNLLTFAVQANGLNADGRRAFMADLKSRLEGLPGVTEVTVASPLPLDGQSILARGGTEEAVADPSKFQQTNAHVVMPGYFEAMRTRLIDGRTFTEADNDSGRVNIVIDRVMAQKAFPGQSAVGKRLFVRLRGNDPEWLDVVGVVEQQRHASLSSEGRETVFVPYGFFFFGGGQRWAVRTSLDPMSLANPARGEVTRLRPGTLVAEMQPMQAFVDRARAPTRFALTAIGIFAVIAAILAAVGLYAVLATSVRQRTAEIGIRMVFGAEQQSIFRLVVGQGLVLGGAGIAIGVIAALALTRVIGSMLVGVTPNDPATLAAIGAGFLAITAVACWLPAWRASHMDPAAAIRDE